MSLHQQLVLDWLLDYKKLNKSHHGDVHTYCIRVESDSATASALFKLLEDQKSHEDFLECICDQLFNYYRCKDQDRLRVFAVSFIPLLIGIHLDQMRRGFPDQKKYHCVDVMLLGMYNLEVVDEDGNAIEKKIRLPQLTKPSVYHEPSTHSMQLQSALTESAVQKIGDPAGPADVMISSFGPYQEYDSIVASSRFNILTVLMKVYNNHLSSVHKESLHSLCKMCVKVLIQPNQSSLKMMNEGSQAVSSSGTKQTLSKQTLSKQPLSKYSDVISKGVARIQPTSQFLVELSSSVHFCLFNDVIIDGRRALERIHSTALYYLFPDVLMMTHAIKNSLRLPCYPASQESEESPEGIVLSSLSPTSNVASNVVASTTGVSKTAITNASFKTKKLPDDIPIVPLSSIEETGEEAPSDGKKESKGSREKDREKDGRGSTPPSKIILKTFMKNRERMKESLSSLKGSRPSKVDVGDERNKLTAEIHNDEIGSVSSGISDTRSIGSDGEMIPSLTNMNRTTVNQLASNNISDGFGSENGYPNGNEHKINEVTIPLISESEKQTTHAFKSNENHTSLD